MKEWVPFGVGRKKIEVSHLLFADDLVLFGRVDEGTTFAMRDILVKFGKVSGQKVNEDKSRLIFSPNTSLEMRELFEDTLNIHASKDLGSYLGLPLSHKRPTRKDVQFVVDKVRRKLANWKTNFLSRAGRLVLLTSTLNTIPSYYLQTQAFPKATLNDLDTLCNNFLWGKRESKQKMHLVGKNHTFLTKAQGGLGIRSNHDINVTMLAKLGWKLGQGKPSLAQKCIQSKYVHKNKITKFQNGSKIWKGVGIGWKLLAENRAWIVGKGDEVRFWEDDWLGIGCLRSWLSGPLTVKEDEVRIRDLWAGGSWDLHAISYPLPDFILNRILEFKIPNPSQNNNPSHNNPDISISALTHKNAFSLSLAYKKLTSNRAPNYDVRWIWDATIPQI